MSQKVGVNIIVQPNKFENITKNKSTPVMRQYWDAKKKYPDAIMLFRMGDFYETFDEDASINVSHKLSITATLVL